MLPRGSPTDPPARASSAFVRGEGIGMEMNFPECRKCEDGTLLPLSDYGRDGAPITYKAWVCSNPTCGFNIRIDNGEISLGRVIGQSSK
jgi:hypothetical protein